MSKFTREERCAWAAGFFEGEGCVYLKHSPATKTHPNGRVTAAITICNSERALLEKFKEGWGGQIRLSTPSKLSKKTLWKWDAFSSAMDRFLADIRPYLSGEKAAKVDQVFELRARQLAIRPKGNGRFIALGKEEHAWRANVKL